SAVETGTQREGYIRVLHKKVHTRIYGVKNAARCQQPPCPRLKGMRADARSRAPLHPTAKQRNQHVAEQQRSALLSGHGLVENQEHLVFEAPPEGSRVQTYEGAIEPTHRYAFLGCPPFK